MRRWQRPEVAMTQGKALILAIFAMCVAVVASNILVQYPIHAFGLGEVLTYGAFTYPFAFLINDLTNRRFGPMQARRVVYAGFAAAVIISWMLATPRLAIASASAFLLAQLLDIAVFSPLRRRTWWQAPLAAAIAGSMLDTILFFALAFAPFFGFIDSLTAHENGSIEGFANLVGLNLPIWASLALGDFTIKIIMALAMLAPYGAFIAFFTPSLYYDRKS